jgi:hypothetical protein
LLGLQVWLTWSGAMSSSASSTNTGFTGVARYALPSAAQTYHRVGLWLSPCLSLHLLWHCVEVVCWWRYQAHSSRPHLLHNFSQWRFSWSLLEPICWHAQASMFAVCVPGKDICYYHIV